MSDDRQRCECGLPLPEYEPVSGPALLQEHCPCGRLFSQNQSDDMPTEIVEFRYEDAKWVGDGENLPDNRRKTRHLIEPGEAHIKSFEPEVRTEYAYPAKEADWLDVEDLEGLSFPAVRWRHDPCPEDLLQLHDAGVLVELEHMGRKMFDAFERLSKQAIIAMREMGSWPLHLADDDREGLSADCDEECDPVGVEGLISDLERVLDEPEDASDRLSLSECYDLVEEQILNVGSPLTKEQRKAEGLTKDCPDCDGTGEVDLSLRAERVVECKRCDGSGEVEG